MGYNHVNGRGHAINHDVKQEPGFAAGGGPSAAIAAFPDDPAEHPLVEAGRARHVRRRHLDVTDLPIRKCGRHRHSFSKRRYSSSFQTEINSAYRANRAI